MPSFWKRSATAILRVASARASVTLAPSAMSAGGTVEDARVVLGAVASRPVEAPAAAAALIGGAMTDAAIANAAERAAQPARPMDNTDFTLVWRKRVTRDFVTYALREIRGDHMDAIRKRTARMLL